VLRGSVLTVSTESIMELEIGERSDPQACAAKVHACVKRGGTAVMFGWGVPAFEQSVRVAAKLRGRKSPKLLAQLRRQPQHSKPSDPFRWTVTRFDPAMLLEAAPPPEGGFLRPLNVGGSAVFPEDI
jgi:hypothetical protein